MPITQCAIMRVEELVRNCSKKNKMNPERDSKSKKLKTIKSRGDFHLESESFEFAILKKFDWSLFQSNFPKVGMF